MQIHFDPRDWFRGGRGGSTHMAGDTAMYAILGSNLLTLGIAFWQQWGLLHLFWPFWIQSVVIGWYARRRILALREFCTEGFTINNRRVDATPATQRRTANFFAFHFGFFHFVYLMFLLVFTLASDDGGLLQLSNADTGEVSSVYIGRVVGSDLIAFALIGFAFWRSHRISHLEHVAADLARLPNIGTLMALPYARVVPMHLCIIFGLLAPTGVGLWLFGALKTGADLLMHKVEHAWLARRR